MPPSCLSRPRRSSEKAVLHDSELEREFIELAGEWRGYFIEVALRKLRPENKRFAADVVQACFLSAWRQLRAAGFRGDASMRTWLTGMVVRTAWKVNSAKARLVDVGVFDPDEYVDETQDFERRFIRQQILRAAQQSLKQQKKRFLAEWADGKYSGTMAGNARNHLHRASNKMRAFAVKHLL